MMEETANPPLRILRVASDSYPEVVGGLSLHVHHLSRVQAEQGHDVTVLASDQGDHSLPRHTDRSGYSLRFHREVARPFDNSITPSLARTLYQEMARADIVHAHSHLFFSTNLAAVAARFTDTPLVITNHGVMSQTGPQWLQKVYLPTVGRFTLNTADCIMCYTETDRDKLQEMGVDARIAVVQNGIDCSLFRPQPDIEEEEMRLLFVGRLKEDKGVRTLIPTVARLRREYDDLTLTIVGDGPLREELERSSVKQGLSDAVTFTGNLSNQELPEIYSRSSVLVLPSKSEGMPRTILEALACETPFVSTDLPQLRPIAEKGGVTVAETTPSRLSEAIRPLLDDSELRAELGRHGRELVLEEYSWDDTVRQTTQEYYRLLEAEESETVPIASIDV